MGFPNTGMWTWVARLTWVTWLTQVTWLTWLTGIGNMANIACRYVDMGNKINTNHMVNIAHRYVDMGAMRFPPSHVLLHGVLAHLKVSEVKF